MSGRSKGVYLKGLNAQSILFDREMDCSVIILHPLGLGKSVQSQLGLSSRTSHLQVQVPQGMSLAASASGSGQAIDLCFERIEGA